MVEEGGFHGGLQQIDQIVVAPHVRQFVGQDRVKLIGGEARQDGCGGQDHRAEPAEGNR